MYNVCAASDVANISYNLDARHPLRLGYPRDHGRQEATNARTRIRDTDTGSDSDSDTGSVRPAQIPLPRTPLGGGREAESAAVCDGPQD